MPSTSSSCSVRGTRAWTLLIHLEDNRNSKEYANGLNKHHKGFIFRILPRRAGILLLSPEWAAHVHLIHYGPEGSFPARELAYMVFESLRERKQSRVAIMATRKRPRRYRRSARNGLTPRRTITGLVSSSRRKSRSRRSASSSAAMQSGSDGTCDISASGRSIHSSSSSHSLRFPTRSAADTLMGCSRD